MSAQLLPDIAYESEKDLKVKVSFPLWVLILWLACRQQLTSFVTCLWEAGRAVSGQDSRENKVIPPSWSSVGHIWWVSCALIYTLCICISKCEKKLKIMGWQLPGATQSPISRSFSQRGDILGSQVNEKNSYVTKVIKVEYINKVLKNFLFHS